MSPAELLNYEMFISIMRPKVPDTTIYDDSIGIDHPVIPLNQHRLPELVEELSKISVKEIGLDSSEETLYVNPDPSRSINVNNEMLATPSIFGLRLEYIYHGIWDISGFLNKHLFLISILNEAYMHIKIYFPKSKVHLKISRDHDSTELYEELVAIIETDLSIKDTMKQLDEFDENWWDDNIDRAQDLLVIMV